MQNITGALKRKIDSVKYEVQKNYAEYQELQSSYSALMDEIRSIKRKWEGEYERWDVQPQLGYFDAIEYMRAWRFKQRYVNKVPEYLKEVNQQRLTEIQNTEATLGIKASDDLIPPEQIRYIIRLVKEMYEKMQQIEEINKTMDDKKKSIISKIKDEIQTYEKEKEKEEGRVSSSEVFLFYDMLQKIDNADQFDKNTKEGINDIIQKFLDSKKELLSVESYFKEIKSFCESFVLLWCYKSIIKDLKDIFKLIFPREKL